MVIALPCRSSVWIGSAQYNAVPAKLATSTSLSIHPLRRKTSSKTHAGLLVNTLPAKASLVS